MSRRNWGKDGELWGLCFFHVLQIDLNFNWNRTGKQQSLIVMIIRSSAASADRAECVSLILDRTQ